MWLHQISHQYLFLVRYRAWFVEYQLNVAKVFIDAVVFLLPDTLGFFVWWYHDWLCMICSTVQTFSSIDIAKR